MSFEFVTKLPTPTEIKEQYPVPEEIKALKAERDAEIADVITGKSDKLLVIIGPCSADNETAVLDYTSRLVKVQEKIKDKVIIIPRVYTNKPRTTGVGYKGMLHQPDPEKKPDLLAGLADQIRQLDQRKTLRLRNIVLRKIVVPGKLAGKHRVVLPHLLLDEGMADSRHQRTPAMFPDALLDRPAAPQIIKNGHGSLAFLAENILRDEGGENIHRNDFALIVDESAAVGVSVEGGSEFRSGLPHLCSDGVQRFRMERIGLVIREVPVQFLVHRNDLEKILDARYFIRSHRVGVIDHDFQFPVHPGKRAQEFPVLLGDVVGGKCARFFRSLEVVLFDKFLNVGNSGRSTDGDIVFPAEFEAVPLLRVVGGGDHDAAVGLQKAVRMIGHRRGAESQVDHVASLFQDPFGKSLEQRFGVGAHVPSDHDFPRSEKLHERSADFLRNFFVQLFGIDPADVICFEDS